MDSVLVLYDCGDVQLVGDVATITLSKSSECSVKNAPIWHHVCSCQQGGQQWVQMRKPSEP